ncbi:Glycine-rich RNA-binding protein 4, mitochondrial [Golovinomyces cichoracearum]|uniref:Glycine-rich RNA-binding protein 4, mitochondrial n=1 Tax=Golovinomyces cichoracearum TaxID=62708 RepID=A0A420HVX5_9PEZI|nr:Glycine-rich RNA-binding protein 4, mitochondrial [Golovinomyces cichoracearum]
MSKLYVSGFSWRVDEQSLRERFEQIGPVEEVTVMRDRDTGQSRGFGFVRYKNEEDAERAIVEINFTRFDMNRIRVKSATQRGQGDYGARGNYGGYGDGGGGY